MEMEQAINCIICIVTVTCFLIQAGLNGQTASTALKLMRISYEKLKFGEELLRYVDEHPEILSNDNAQFKLPL